MSGKRTSSVWITPKDELQEIMNRNMSLRDVLGELGLSKNSSGSFKALKKRIKEDGLDTSIIDENRKKSYNRNKVKTPLEDILVENSDYSRSHLKSRLIKEGLLKNECNECGLLPNWNGKSLVMILDHINGINNDNRIENLRLLCPNCNSQQDTFAGRNQKEKIKPKCKCCDGNVNKDAIHGMCAKCYGKSKSKRKIERPSKEVLLSQIKEFGYVGTGKIYGVSDNAIRKWLK